MVTTREIVAVFGGGDILSDGNVLVAAPNHGRRDRSLSILPLPDGRVLVNTFSPRDDRLTLLRYVEDKLGIDTRRSAPKALLVDRTKVRALQAQVEEEARRKAESTTRAVRLFNEADASHGSPVEAYLQLRRLALPSGAEQWVRYHPSCPFAGQRTPAMVCLARDVVTDEPKAVHRTAISADGHAVEINGNKRLSLGPIGGAAIKITPHAEVRDELGIGEGIETTLTLSHVSAFANPTLWSLLSAGNLAKLPLLACVRKLWIATDHDDAGLKASRALASRWRRAGRQAVLIIPTTPKLDLNDLLMGEAVA